MVRLRSGNRLNLSISRARGVLLCPLLKCSKLRTSDPAPVSAVSIEPGNYHPDGKFWDGIHRPQEADLVKLKPPYFVKLFEMLVVVNSDPAFWGRNWEICLKLKSHYYFELA